MTAAGIDKGMGLRGRPRPAMALLVLALAGSLAACGKKERPETPPPPPPPQVIDQVLPPAAQPLPGLTTNQRLARVVTLLNANDEATARVELNALLIEEPNRREALVLQQSIEGDPRAMVPSDSFAYVVQPEDTYITIARDFLGDSYKFHALARLNGIPATALKAGDTIKIPGRYWVPRRERREPTRAAPIPRAVPNAPATSPAPVQVPRANPAAAQRLRRAGLESMSAGRIDLAVARLEQASRLDPGNGAIAGDLARARRIQATIRQRN